MAKANLQQQAASSFDTLFGARTGGERSVSGGFKMLAHERITVRPQVRRTFAASEVDELRGSIHELRAQSGGIEGTGVLQALLVCPEGDGYRLIAGEKRFRATQAEGLPEIPCIVVPSPSEGMIRLLQLTENAIRTSPPVLEEARAIRETMEQQKLSLRDMARMLGKTLGYVSNRTAILKMSEDVQSMIEARGDTLKHAPLIEAVEDPSIRAQMIRLVVEEGISVRELERRLAPKEAENGHQVFSRENTSTGNDDAPPSDQESKVFSRENTLAASQRADEGGGSVQDSAKSSEVEGSPATPNPIETELVPARRHAVAAIKLLRDLPMDSEYKDQVRAAVEDLDKQVSRLKKLFAS